jgi:hypothetical protein
MYWSKVLQKGVAVLWLAGKGLAKQKAMQQAVLKRAF